MIFKGTTKDREGNENYLDTTELEFVPKIKTDFSCLNVKNLKEMSLDNYTVESVIGYKEEDNKLILTSTLNDIVIVNEIEDASKFVDEGADAYYKNKSFEDVETIKEIMKKNLNEISSILERNQCICTGIKESTAYIGSDNNLVLTLDNYNLIINKSDFKATIERHSLVNFLALEDILNMEDLYIKIPIDDKTFKTKVEKFSIKNNICIFELVINDSSIILDEDIRTTKKDDFDTEEDWKEERLNSLHFEINNDLAEINDQVFDDMFDF